MKARSFFRLNTPAGIDMFCGFMRAVMILCALLTVLQALKPAVAWGEGADYTDNGMIRLHILANSDSKRDQQVKLAVRDAIRGEVAALLEGARDADQAYRRIADALPALEAFAVSELERQGEDYGARAMLGEFDFPDRAYAGVTVPAGRYQAVRILLGEGVGQNWWCVLYPDLCFVDRECAKSAGQGEGLTFYSSILQTIEAWLKRGDAA